MSNVVVIHPKQNPLSGNLNLTYDDVQSSNPLDKQYNYFEIHIPPDYKINNNTPTHYIVYEKMKKLTEITYQNLASNNFIIYCGHVYDNDGIIHPLGKSQSPLQTAYFDILAKYHENEEILYSKTSRYTLAIDTKPVFTLPPALIATDVVAYMNTTSGKYREMDFSFKRGYTWSTEFTIYLVEDGECLEAQRDNFVVNTANTYTGGYNSLKVRITIAGDNSDGPHNRNKEKTSTFSIDDAIPNHCYVLRIFSKNARGFPYIDSESYFGVTNSIEDVYPTLSGNEDYDESDIYKDFGRSETSFIKVFTDDAKAYSIKDTTSTPQYNNIMLSRRRNDDGFTSQSVSTKLLYKNGNMADFEEIDPDEWDYNDTSTLKRYNHDRLSPRTEYSYKHVMVTDIRKLTHNSSVFVENSIENTFTTKSYWDDAYSRGIDDITVYANPHMSVIPPLRNISENGILKWERPLYSLKDCMHTGIGMYQVPRHFETPWKLETKNFATPTTIKINDNGIFRNGDIIGVFDSQNKYCVATVVWQTGTTNRLRCSQKTESLSGISTGNYRLYFQRWRRIEDSTEYGEIDYLQVKSFSFVGDIPTPSIICGLINGSADGEYTDVIFEVCPITYNIYYNGILKTSVTNTFEYIIDEGIIENYNVTACVNVLDAKSFNTIEESDPWVVSESTIKYEGETLQWNAIQKPLELNPVSLYEYGRTGTQEFFFPKDGWKIISFYIYNEEKSTYPSIFASVEDSVNIKIVNQLDITISRVNGVWESNDTSASPQTPYDLIDYQYSVKIKCSQNVEFSLTGNIFTKATISLSKGFNMLAWLMPFTLKTQPSGDIEALSTFYDIDCRSSNGPAGELRDRIVELRNNDGLGMNADKIQQDYPYTIEKGTGLLFTEDVGACTIVYNINDWKGGESGEQCIEEDIPESIIDEYTVDNGVEILPVYDSTHIWTPTKFSLNDFSFDNGYSYTSIPVLQRNWEDSPLDNNYIRPKTITLPGHSWLESTGPKLINLYIFSQSDCVGVNKSTKQTGDSFDTGFVLHGNDSKWILEHNAAASDIDIPTSSAGFATNKNISCYCIVESKNKFYIIPLVFKSPIRFVSGGRTYDTCELEMKNTQFALSLSPQHHTTSRNDIYGPQIDITITPYSSNPKLYKKLTETTVGTSTESPYILRKITRIQDNNTNEVIVFGSDTNETDASSTLQFKDNSQLLFATRYRYTIHLYNTITFEEFTTSQYVTTKSARPTSITSEIYSDGEKSQLKLQWKHYLEDDGITPSHRTIPYSIIVSSYTVDGYSHDICHNKITNVENQRVRMNQKTISNIYAKEYTFDEEYLPNRHYCFSVGTYSYTAYNTTGPFEYVWPTHSDSHIEVTYHAKQNPLAGNLFITRDNVQATNLQLQQNYIEIHIPIDYKINGTYTPTHYIVYEKYKKLTIVSKSTVEAQDNAIYCAYVYNKSNGNTTLIGHDDIVYLDVIAKYESNGVIYYSKTPPTTTAIITPGVPDIPVGQIVTNFTGSMGTTSANYRKFTYSFKRGYTWNTKVTLYASPQSEEDKTMSIVSNESETYNNTYRRIHQGVIINGSGDGPYNRNYQKTTSCTISTALPNYSYVFRLFAQNNKSKPDELDDIVYFASTSDIDDVYPAAQEMGGVTDYPDDDTYQTYGQNGTSFLIVKTAEPKEYTLGNTQIRVTTYEQNQLRLIRYRTNDGFTSQPVKSVLLYKFGNMDYVIIDDSNWSFFDNGTSKTYTHNNLCPNTEYSYKHILSTDIREYTTSAENIVEHVSNEHSYTTESYWNDYISNETKQHILVAPHVTKLNGQSDKLEWKRQYHGLFPFDKFDSIGATVQYYVPKHFETTWMPQTQDPVNPTVLNIKDNGLFENGDIIGLFDGLDHICVGHVIWGSTSTDRILKCSKKGGTPGITNTSSGHYFQRWRKSEDNPDIGYIDYLHVISYENTSKIGFLSRIEGGPTEGEYANVTFGIVPILFTIYYNGIQIDTTHEYEYTISSNSNKDEFIVTAKTLNISGSKSKTQIYESNPWNDDNNISYFHRKPSSSKTHIHYMSSTDSLSNIVYGSTGTQNVDFLANAWKNTSFYVIDTTKLTFATLFEDVPSHINITILKQNASKVERINNEWSTTGSETAYDTINFDKAYFIKLTHAYTLSIHGYTIKEHTISLSPGLNFLNWSMPFTITRNPNESNGEFDINGFYQLQCKTNGVLDKKLHEKLSSIENVDGQGTSGNYLTVFVTLPLGGGMKIMQESLPSQITYQQLKWGYIDENSSNENTRVTVNADNTRTTTTTTEVDGTTTVSNVIIHEDNTTETETISTTTYTSNTSTTEETVLTTDSGTTITTSTQNTDGSSVVQTEQTVTNENGDDVHVISTVQSNGQTQTVETTTSNGVSTTSTADSSGISTVHTTRDEGLSIITETTRSSGITTTQETSSSTIQSDDGTLLAQNRVSTESNDSSSLVVLETLNESTGEIIVATEHSNGLVSTQTTSTNENGDLVTNTVNSDGTQENQVQSVTTSGDGSSVTVIITTNTSGKNEKVTETVSGNDITRVTENTDGSVVTQTTTTDSNNNIVIQTNNSDGTSTTQTQSILQNEDGSTSNQTITTRSDGSSITKVENILQNEDGTSSVQTISTSSDGSSITKVENVLQNQDGSTSNQTIETRSDGSSVTNTVNVVIENGVASTETVATHSDGRTITSVVSVMTNEDNSTSNQTITTSSDGSSITKIENVLTNEDGSTSIQTVSTLSDGSSSTETKRVNENNENVVETQNSDGTHTTRTEAILSNGSTQIVVENSDGTTETTTQNVVTDSNGKTQTVTVTSQSNGQTETQTQTVTQDANGVSITETITEYSNGLSQTQKESIVVHDDGSTSKHIETTQADGLTVISVQSILQNDDGSTSTQTVITQQDGSTETSVENMIILNGVSSKETVTTRSDGSSTTQTESVMTNEDGSTSIQTTTTEFDGSSTTQVESVVINTDNTTSKQKVTTLSNGAVTTQTETVVIDAVDGSTSLQTVTNHSNGSSETTLVNVVTNEDGSTSIQTTTTSTDGSSVVETVSINENNETITSTQNLDGTHQTKTEAVVQNNDGSTSIQIVSASSDGSSSTETRRTNTNNDIIVETQNSDGTHTTSTKTILGNGNSQIVVNNSDGTHSTVSTSVLENGSKQVVTTHSSGDVTTETTSHVNNETITETTIVNHTGVTTKETSREDVLIDESGITTARTITQHNDNKSTVQTVAIVSGNTVTTTISSDGTTERITEEIITHTDGSTSSRVTTTNASGNTVVNKSINKTETNNPNNGTTEVTIEAITETINPDGATETQKESVIVHDDNTTSLQTTTIHTDGSVTIQTVTINDSQERVTQTVDADGNETIVVESHIQNENNTTSKKVETRLPDGTTEVVIDTVSVDENGHTYVTTTKTREGEVVVDEADSTEYPDIDSSKRAYYTFTNVERGPYHDTIQQYIYSTLNILDTLVVSFTGTPVNINLSIAHNLQGTSVLGYADTSGLPEAIVKLNPDNIGTKTKLNNNEVELNLVVLLHETIHSLGFGTSHNWTSLVNGKNDEPPSVYKGYHGVVAYKRVLTNMNHDITHIRNYIPLEDDFGPGVEGGHFEEGIHEDESIEIRRIDNVVYPIFSTEIMTGFSNENTYISIVTLGVLQDIGWTVNYDSKHVVDTFLTLSEQLELQVEREIQKAKEELENQRELELSYVYNIRFDTNSYILSGTDALGVVSVNSENPTITMFAGDTVIFKQEAFRAAYYNPLYIVTDYNSLWPLNYEIEDETIVKSTQGRIRVDFNPVLPGIYYYQHGRNPNIYGEIHVQPERPIVDVNIALAESYENPTIYKSLSLSAIDTVGKIYSWGQLENNDMTLSESDNADFIYLTSNHNGSAALKSDGTLYSWGPDISSYPDESTFIRRNEENTPVGHIVGSFKAFSALDTNGFIHSWGPSEYGGDGPGILKNKFIQIVADTYTFSALNEDGTVLSWGESPTYVYSHPPRNDYVALYSNQVGFAGLTHKGYVYTWGTPGTGGEVVSPWETSEYSNPPPVTEFGFVYIKSTSLSMLGVKSDNTFVGWGKKSQYTGYPTSKKAIQKIVSTETAYTILYEDGTLYTWGEGTNLTPPGGGIYFTNVFASGKAFAALDTNGVVYTWGDVIYGGSNGPSTDGWVSLYGNKECFVALHNNGQIYGWGGVDDSHIHNLAPQNTTMSFISGDNRQVFNTNINTYLSDTTLKNVHISGVELSPRFSPTIYSYTGILPYNPDSNDVEIIIRVKGGFSVTGNIGRFQVNNKISHVFTITSYSQDKNFNTYTFTLYPNTLPTLGDFLKNLNITEDESNIHISLA